VATTTITGSPLPEPLVDFPIAFHAPGRSGSVTTLQAVPGGRASGDPLDLAVAAAGADVDVDVVSSLEVRLDASPGAQPAGGRGTDSLPPALVLPKRDGIQCAALQTDEYGESRWILPQPAPAGTRLELPPTVPRAGAGGRGEVTQAMRRIVRIVAWAAQPVLGKGALAAARAWEASRRPYRVLQVTRAGEFVEPDWQRLAGGPLLLLVHGTFSTPQAGFAGWVGEGAFAAVSERYGDRCLALAHPSLSASPNDNLEWLRERWHASVDSPIDIVCHSRGGLVSRAIAGDERLKVRRVCQVGVPNAGTPLADEAHMLDFLDGHTALLTLLPDTVTTIVLEGVLSVVKLLATGGLGGLPGLTAMEPRGEYLETLGRRTLRAESWYTIGADYRASAEEKSPFTRRLADKIADRVFTESNDLVVPSEGCHSPGPLLTDSLRLTSAAVHHTNYFSSPEVHAKLNSWLQ
jgi:hypothetical protein